jgi:hypothetical protein
VTGLTHVVEASEGTLTVLDHQIRFERTGSTRVWQLSAGQVRRVQMDVEVGRPATVAIVPNEAGMEAQLLTVSRDQFEALSAAILHLAVDLDDASRA